MTTQQTGVMIESQDFDLNAFAFDQVDDASWEKATQQKARPLDPGNHTLKIQQIRNLGPDAIDPRWYNLSIDVVDEKGTRYGSYVKMPTVTPEYTNRDGKVSRFELVKFKEFATALGLDVTDQKKTQATLSKMAEGIPKTRFDNKMVACELGFGGDHLEMVSSGAYRIVDRKNEQLVGSADVYESRDSAQEWYGATHQSSTGKPYKLKFIEVRRFGNSDLRTK
jgi:hypothetical protein